MLVVRLCSGLAEEVLVEAQNPILQEPLEGPGVRILLAVAERCLAVLATTMPLDAEMVVLVRQVQGQEETLAAQAARLAVGAAAVVPTKVEVEEQAAQEQEAKLGFGPSEI